MIKILHVVSSLGGGGVENMLFNYYMQINKNMIQFDFIVHGDNIGMLEEKVKVMGAKVYHVTPKKLSFKKNKQEIEEIIRNGNYNVVHCHQNFSNFLPLFIAKNYNIPVRISHAHGCKEVKNITEKMQNSILRFLNQSYANYFFACGIEAGKWLHGKKWTPNEKNIIMNNAIDTNKFCYNKEVREKYRQKLKIEDKIVLLHVGRFSDEKNHLFMIDIMEQLSKESSKYILLLVGNGAMEEKVRKYVLEKGLENRIIFLGVRDDVAELMNAADIFLLPSKNEGFPVTLVEAQSVGLTVYASDKVTKETAITDLIQYLPIDSLDIWVEKILNYKITLPKSHEKYIENAEYSIFKQADKYTKWLEKIFINEML